MQEIENLKMIALQGRVADELRSSLNIEDEDLTDFLIHKCIVSPDEDTFFITMNKEDESFTYDLASSIFFLVKSVFPTAKSLLKEPVEEEDLKKDQTDQLKVEEFTEEKTAFKVPQNDSVVEIDYFEIEKRLSDSHNKIKQILTERSKKISKSNHEKKSSKKRKDSFSSSESDIEELQINKVYRAEVVRVFAYGLLIRTSDALRQIGLVHISKIKNEKIEDLSKEFKPFDKVFAKCVEVRPDDKVCFSMKGINQRNGKEEQPDESEFFNKKNKKTQYMDEQTLREYESYLMNQEYGPLTGIKLDFQTNDKGLKNNAHSAVDAWEKTR